MLCKKVARGIECIILKQGLKKSTYSILKSEGLTRIIRQKL
jgi:hypothetical protein